MASLLRSPGALALVGAVAFGGVLYLTIFAPFRLYALAPAALALGLMLAGAPAPLPSVPIFGSKHQQASTPERSYRRRFRSRPELAPGQRPSSAFRVNDASRTATASMAEIACAPVPSKLFTITTNATCSPSSVVT